MCSFYEVSLVDEVIVAAVIQANNLINKILFISISSYHYNCDGSLCSMLLINWNCLHIRINLVVLCVDCRGLRSGRHLDDDDDIVPELAHIHPRERPDWEETISAMVRYMLGHRLIWVFSSLLIYEFDNLLDHIDLLFWCCTSFTDIFWFITHHDATSETLASLLLCIFRNIYSSSIPVPCCLFHRSPGNIISLFPPVFGLDSPCILHQ